MSLATRVTATLRRRAKAVAVHTRANERLINRFRIGADVIRDDMSVAAERKVIDAAEAGVNAALERDWYELPLEVRRRMASAAAAAAREVQPFDSDQVQAAAEAAARGVLEEDS